jgi:hypothetical protein
MSMLRKSNPGPTEGKPGPETRARAALVEMESREPEASKNIKAIGRDPEAIPESVASLDAAELYAPGKRTERRQVLLRHAVEYLFEVNVTDERGQDRVIARMGARTKIMVDWMIGIWEGYLRPKTWMDSLNFEQQEKWAEAKRQYDRRIEAENMKLRKAREVYDNVVREVHMSQATEREKLKEVLRDFGLTEAPILSEVPADRGMSKLADELAILGVNFRPPESKQH